jgi:subtilisin family serine protease
MRIRWGGIYLLLSHVVILVLLSLSGHARLHASNAVSSALTHLGQSVSADDVSSKIDPVVWEAIQEEGQVDFFIWLGEQADVSPAPQFSSKQEKGQHVYESLLLVAEQSQKELRSYLDSQSVNYRPFYIVNAILVRQSDPELLLAVALRPEVERILPNRAFQLQEPFVNPTSPAQTATVESNITFVRADEVWALGITGEGTVMAGGDTGLQWNHPALINQYRGWNGTSVDHNYNWWDATGVYPDAPADGHGHGTHTHGTMVGSEGGANQIGMAPGAKTIHCRNMTDSGWGNDYTFLTCFEWVLAPWDLNGNNPRPDLAPDAMNNSWGYWAGGAGQFATAISNLHAAGILVEVSAGNEGSSCWSLRSPGDYAAVLTTGSVNHSGGSLPGWLTYFSSRGPSPLDPDDFFPDVMAPGENIRSSLPGNNYGSWSGTSMAGPHVTGLIGLMWSANPALQGMVEETIQLIKNTAVPLTGMTGSNCGGDYDVGPNHDWGYGTIDALAAVQAAILFGGTGLLQGTVTDASTGLPITGAAIQATLSPTLTWQTTSNELGHYARLILSGTYTVTASAFAYLPEVMSGVEVMEDTTTELNFALESAPSYLVQGVVSDANTGWPLYARIDIGGYPYGPLWTDPATGEYSVVLPAGTAFNFIVSSWSAGYLPENRTVGPLLDDVTEEFQLNVDIVACVAPGYTLLVSDLFGEDFESGFSSWTMNGLWNEQSHSSTCGSYVAPFPSPIHAAYYGDPAICNYDVGTNSGSLTLNVPQALPADAMTYLSYWSYESTGCWWEPCATDLRLVEVTNDGGENWHWLGSGASQYYWHERTLSLAAYQGDEVQIRFRFDSVDSYDNYYFGWMVDDVRLQSAACVPQAGGLLVGNVYDGNYETALNGATVARDGSGVPAVPTPLDPANDDAFYVMFAPVGSHTVTAAMPQRYGMSEATIDVLDGQTVRQDFWLPAGWLTIDSENLTLALELGASQSVPLILNNIGGLPLTYEFKIKELGYEPLSLNGVRPQGQQPVRLEGYDPHALTTAGGINHGSMQRPETVAGGAVIAQWPTALAYPWGTGFNADDETVWFNNMGAAGGDDHNHEFTVSGSATGHNLPALYGGTWAADLAYNTDTGMFWQVNVGGDNCIHEFDPVQGATGNKICNPGWTYTSQRGLAYDPVSDTYFVGGWNTYSVHRIDATGDILESWYLGLMIAGLAFNHEAGLLFIIENSWNDAIWVFDITTNTFVNWFTVSGFGAYAGSGLAIDCDGNLWAANQNNKNAYLIDSGVPASLCHGGSSWLSIVPDSGTLPALSEVVVAATFDASVPEVNQPGEYQAVVRIKNSTPYDQPIIPVVMTVTAPPAYGRIEGTVSGLGRCDDNPSLLAGSHITISGSQGVSWQLSTDQNGRYQLWLHEDHSPLTVAVAFAGHEEKLLTDVTVMGQTTSLADVDLRWLGPCAAVEQESLDVTLIQGAETSTVLTVINAGAGPLTFDILERQRRPGPLLPIAGKSWSYSAPAPVGPLSARSVEAQQALAGSTATVMSNWTAGTSLPWDDGVMRYAHAQCADDPDSFYVISGVRQYSYVTHKVWRYDAPSDTWSQLAALPAALEGATAVCYEEYIYVAGGSATNQFYIYDVAGDSWTAGPPLPRGVWGAAMGALNDRIYLIGGSDSFYYGSASAEVNVYDIIAGAWNATGTPMPTATFASGFAQAGDHLYVVGGWGNSSPGQNVNQTQRYHMATDSWEIGPTFTSARADLGLAVTGNYLHALGGDADGNWYFDVTAEAEKLDHSAWPAGAWSPSRALPLPLMGNRGGFCTETNTGGEVWSVGGGLDHGMVSALNLYQAAEPCFRESSDIPWLAVELSAGNVAADDRLDVAITFTAPPEFAPAIYEAMLMVRSSDSANRRIEIPVSMTVAEAQYGVELTSLSAEGSARPGASITYTLRLTNTGSLADSFNLSLSESQWQTALSQTNVSLDSGQATDVIVTISVPATAADGAMDNVTVTATAVGSSQTGSATLTGTAMWYRLFLPWVVKP